MHIPDLTRRRFLATAAVTLAARNEVSGADAGFFNPPWEARPSTYWVWLNGFTDPKRLTYELEELKKAGFNAVYILEIGTRGQSVPAGPAYFGPESLEAIAHVVREAGRLGIDVGITNASSWNAGGSWVPPEHAAKGLYWTRTVVEGPTHFTQALPFPKLAPTAPDPPFYSDAAVLALPESERLPGFDFVIDLAPGAHTLERVVLHNAEAATAAKEFVVFASETGAETADFREICRGTLEARTGPQSFPCSAAVRARFLKLRIVSGYHPNRTTLAEFEGLSADGKNVVTVQTPIGRKLQGGLLRFTAEAGFSREWMAENIYDGRLEGARGSWAVDGPLPPFVRKRGDIVDLTAHFRDGRLDWAVPAGRWSLYRFVSANNGQKVVLPSPHSDGLIIDHFSAAATRMHTEYMLGRLRSRLGDLRKSALKYFYACSYEVRASIWTPTFLEEFRQRRGYDALPFLPVLAGAVVESDDVCDRFRLDYRRTVSDLFIENFYATSRRVAEREGLKLVSEAGGPGWPLHQVPVDALKAQSAVSVPRGEFWKVHSVNVVKETASAAHIYGQPIVQMESFTSFRHWQDAPRDLKEIADMALCDGCNQFVWHTMPHVPEVGGKPGWAYHAGTHNGPNEAWWPLGRPFFDYLARCSWMLRQGLFVADICYYYGDRGYNFAPEKSGAAELGLPPGYDFDTVNSDVILNRMSVKDGRLVLPDGMSYALMLLPDRREMDPAVLAKIETLVRDGAVICGPAPRQALGLANYPAADEEVRRIAARLWGAGKIQANLSPGEILKRRGLGPDFTAEADFDFIHRRHGARDIYFVRNKAEKWVEAACTFRVKGRNAQLWDAVSGLTNPLPTVAASGGARATLKLAPFGSAFVIFDPAFRPAPKASSPRLPAPVEIGGPWEVRFAEGWGAPASRSFSRLHSWTDDDDAGVRYFSGIATYGKVIRVPEALLGGTLLLDLGDVCSIARVRLNGKPAGGCWTVPFQVELTGLVKPGDNLLEIEVANTWSNRLTGDALAAGGRKYTNTNIRWSKDTALLPSGLLGPVRLMRA